MVALPPRGGRLAYRLVAYARGAGRAYSRAPPAGDATPGLSNVPRYPFRARGAAAQQRRRGLATAGAIARDGPASLDKQHHPCNLERMNAPPRLVALALTGVWIVGCGGSGERRTSGRAGQVCAHPPGDSAYFVATQEYLKGITPKPRRLLYPVGTDSTPPAAAIRALQDAGPSYLFPSDPAGQKKVLDRLEEVGPWTALLVSWHGVERLGESAAVVRLRGHFLLGQDTAAQTGLARALRFECEGGSWRFTRAEDERAS